METFSKRFGHSQNDKEITVREDAPQSLREFLIMTLYHFDYTPFFLRDVICKVLRVAPDRNNWTDYPNIDGEVHNLIENCDWYKIYDIIEAFARQIKEEKKQLFHDDLNDFFRTNGIGWKLENGLIQMRGDETFETAIKKVESTLEDAKLKTAKSEIKEAIADLSRRPNPDITGAIQHSLASLECVCREVSGKKNATLGDIMKIAGTIIPTPLDQVISKIWGYSSEQGRHLKEGKEPEYLEAELVVELSATISNYLGKKLISIGSGAEKDDDLPFY
ncbi:hypothetical protein GFS24_17960 [Chitinophaga sp. SYP-B3965]|uniref:AbiJ-NTD4 domain-containing protein n=1 Tax=Chitinophaga sp. SYP-B3965 TaxID=2663120 RepID=UPI0012999659|nr:hypothetical protein [Chitinophaga sp. SYP-B3965]MRG47013.1 hypothetical protein [Chitinophaga sp. SYP-B3965]